MLRRARGRSASAPTAVKILRTLASLLALLLAFAACSKEASGPADDLVREKAARFFNLPNGEFGNAREALRPLVERKDARADDLLAAAAIEYGELKPEAAEPFLERARKLEPRHPGVHYLLGQLFRERTEYAKAREHFRLALEGAPNDLPTKLGLAECEFELGDAQRAEALYREVVAVGIENGQQWYVTAVFRMTRLLVNFDDRASDLAKYNALWIELEKRGQKAADPVRFGLGELARMRAPKPAGTKVERPACPPALVPGPAALPELAGATRLETWDVDGDLDLDLVAWGAGGARVALRRDKGWKHVVLGAAVARVLAAFDLDNAPDGASWLTFLVEEEGALRLLHPDPEAETWSRWPIELPALPSPAAAALAVDIDHEGDMDLVVVGTFGARLWRNDGANALAKEAADGRPATPAGAFVDATEGAGFPAFPLAWVVSEDLDGDNDVDLLFGGGSQVFLADSLRACRFADRTRTAFGAETPTGPVLLADFDGDARVDLWTPTALWRQEPDHTFAKEPIEPVTGTARLADLDLDGAVDLLAATPDAFAVARLAVGQPASLACTLGGSGLPALESAPFAVGDFDGDQTVDVAMVTPNGLRIAPFPSGENRAVRVSYRGLRDNRRAVGAVVELKAGPIYRRVYWRGQPELLGVGRNAKVDVLRITWPNGVVQTQLDLDLRPQAGVDDPDAAFGGLTQDNTLIGSCPFLYTWDGERFVFVTDVLGITPLGLPMAPGMLVPPDHDEYVLVKGEQLVPKDGALVLQVTEELREVTYLDQAKLLVVDHPVGTEVFPNERFTFPPFPEHHVHTVKDPLAPAKALGSDGKDWTEALGRIDDRHALPFTKEPDQFMGLAKPWFLELEFDRARVAKAKTLRLVMTGWFLWSDASANMASARTPDVRFVPPLLQVPDGPEGGGGWRDTGPPVGFPAGKTKTMVIDVSTLIDRDDPRVRVFTTLQLFWDSIRLAVDDDDALLGVRELDVASARLWMRGFSAPLGERKPGATSELPERFDWHRTAEFPRWNQHPGLYTKYGDVTPLVRAVEDRYVILGAGDALTLTFDAKELAPPAAGMRRDYLLFLDGWEKDRAPNTLEALEVEPLPFHGMSGYPYRPDERFPDSPEHRAWRAEWNTRPAHQWIAPVAPDRQKAWLLGGP